MYSNTAAAETTASLPVEATRLNPKRLTSESMLIQILPLCDISPTLPASRSGSARPGNKVALRA